VAAGDGRQGGGQTGGFAQLTGDRPGRDEGVVDDGFAQLTEAGRDERRRGRGFAQPTVAARGDGGVAEGGVDEAADSHD